MNEPPTHVLTLTGNLLAERTLEFATWSPGRTHRALAENFQVGGKGINVSKMLGRLGIPNTALCFTGGAPGAECEAWLRAHRFDVRAFPTTTATRSGAVVRSRDHAHGETTFLGPDAPPDPAALRACADFLDAQPAGRVLALCGSFPGWSDAAFEPLRRALLRWIEHGALVADTYGPPLAWLARQPVRLIKINADELRTLGPAAQPRPGQNWIITDGPREVRLTTDAGETRTFQPPPIREISPTGSGDVLFACVLAAWLFRGLPLADAIAFALPFAAANAAHKGVAEFDLPAPLPPLQFPPKSAAFTTEIPK